MQDLIASQDLGFTQMNHTDEYVAKSGRIVAAFWG